jgi:hypothetical protein
MVADHQGRGHQIVISRLVHQKADPRGCTFYNVLFPDPDIDRAQRIGYSTT